MCDDDAVVAGAEVVLVFAVVADADADCVGLTWAVLAAVVVVAVVVPVPFVVPVMLDVVAVADPTAFQH